MSKKKSDHVEAPAEAATVVAEPEVPPVTEAVIDTAPAEVVAPEAVAAEPAPGAPRDGIAVAMAEKPRSHAFTMHADAETLLQGLRALPQTDTVRVAQAHLSECIKTLRTHLDEMP